MFRYDSNLIDVNLSSFDTSNVVNMQGMFSDCSHLTYLDLSGFNTSNVTDMSEMFLNCSQLTEMDIYKFHTAKVQSINDMFKNCTNLVTIYRRAKFILPELSEPVSIFEGCTSLPDYDSSYTTTTKATLHQNGGYFTFRPVAYLDQFGTQKLSRQIKDYVINHSVGTLNINVENNTIIVCRTALN